MAFRKVLAALLWFGAAHAAPAPPELPAAARPDGSLLSASDDGCQRKCGEVDIPFPFGYGPAHCMLPDFEIDCRNDSASDGLLKAFLGRNSNIEVLSIALLSGQVRVLNHISSYCYNASSGNMEPSEWYMDIKDPFMFSDTDNKFTVVGCRTLAYIGDRDDDEARYMTGCVAMCRSDDPTALTNGSCSGMGCCQTAIPSRLQYYQVWFDQGLSASSGNQSNSPCSYAVLTESSNFTFSTSYVTSSSDLLGGLVPVLLNWAIGEGDCAAALTKPDYACVSHKSGCMNAADGGGGYICYCKEGFHGNPYLPDGCKGESATHHIYLFFFFYSTPRLFYN